MNIEKERIEVIDAKGCAITVVVAKNTSKEEIQRKFFPAEYNVKLVESWLSGAITDAQLYHLVQA